MTDWMPVLIMALVVVCVTGYLLSDPKLRPPGKTASGRSLFPVREGRFNWLFDFTTLKVSWFSYLDGCALAPLRPFLDGQTFDPEIVRLMGVAFEAARAAVNRPADLTDEMIANKIIELANAGERNVKVLCEAALNVPTGAVSAPSPPRPRASLPEPPGSSS